MHPDVCRLPDKILIRHKTPATAVIAVIPVVAHCKIVTLRHRDRPMRKKTALGARKIRSALVDQDLVPDPCQVSLACRVPVWFTPDPVPW